MKQSSRRGNFKNIVKTVVDHHQLWLTYHLKCTNHLLSALPEDLQSDILLAADMLPSPDDVILFYITSGSKSIVISSNSVAFCYLNVMISLQNLEKSKISFTLRKRIRLYFMLHFILQISSQAISMLLQFYLHLLNLLLMHVLCKNIIVCFLEKALM